MGALSPPLAAADELKVDFESGPPLDTSIENEYRESAFVFWERPDPGFRPYREQAAPGVATQSGSFYADISDHCYPGESDNASDCEIFIPGTQGNLVRTASGVTLYAGLSSASGETVSAKLTAYDASHLELDSAEVLIGVGFTTPISVSSVAANIASFFLTVEGPGKYGAALGFDDLTLDFPTNSLPDISLAAPTETVAVLQGGSVEAPLRVTRLNGSNGPVAFSVTGLPPGVTGTVTPEPLAGTQTNAVIHLTAADDAEVTALKTATVTADPLGNAIVAPEPRSAQFNVRVARSFGIAGNGEALHLPQCAPVDREFVLERDRSFGGTLFLSVEGLPAGVHVQILPSTVIPPGGNFNVNGTLRVSRSAEPVPPESVLTLRARASGFPDQTLAVPIDNAAPVATASPGFARTPRRELPGTTVRLDGNGFCPGSEVDVGTTPSGEPNLPARAEATVADDLHSLTFQVPRAGTSGQVTVLPPASGGVAGPGFGPSYRTQNSIEVRSFRGEFGFAFPNYHFSGLSISELTEAVGADDLFIQINPCWPWGSCYVPTGILDPIAAIEWPLFSGILVGGDGHCYGMNRAVQEFMAHKVPYNRFASGVHDVFDLPSANGPQNGLSGYLDSRQALQLTAEALYRRLTRDPRLGVQLERIQYQFEHGMHPGVTMKHGTIAGHEVTATDIVHQPDGSLEILSYDNNFPQTQKELGAPSTHSFMETDGGAIRINAAHDHWEFTSAGGTEFSGGGDDGSLYAVPLEDIPDNPSLPGLTDLDLIVDIFASVEGAATTGGASAGAEDEPLVAGAGGNEHAGMVLAKKGVDSLSHTMKGLKGGSYSQLIAGPGFVAATPKIETAKGVVDKMSIKPVAGKVSFVGGRDRELELDLAMDRGRVHRGASVETTASKGGEDVAALGHGKSLVYTHNGGGARVRISLTNVARAGGPATFRSPGMTVRRGERLKLTPLDWHSLDRVRVTARLKGGKTRTRVLRNTAGANERFALGRPRLKGHRASVSLRLLHVSQPAVGGLVLRLLRGNRIVAKKAIAIKHPKRGRRTFHWRLPHVPPGGYRLLANAALAGGADHPSRRTAAHLASVGISR